ncbi:MAG: hypothetical protein RLZZ584_4046 [Pseudomonadota bacterium]|jgi:hypothetical protein
MLFHPLRAAGLAPVLALLALCASGLARAADKSTFAPVSPPPQISGAAGVPPPAAATPAMPAAPAPAASTIERGAAQAGNTSVSSEAGVRTTVIEDSGSRIEELKVRGNVRSIHVAPKGVGAGLAYEVLPAVGPAGPRDTAPGPGSAHSSAGQRVWSLFSF